MKRLVLLCAALALAGTAAWWLWGLASEHDRGGPLRRWFYDLRTHQLFPGDMQASPPIAAPSDSDGERSGVLAVVVKTPTGTSEIAYLMSGSQPGKPAPTDSMPATWICLPDGANWISGNGPQAAEILRRARTLSGGGLVILDYPPDHTP